MGYECDNLARPQVLGGPAQWNEETLKHAVDSERIRTVFRKEPLPVLILCFTASVELDGELRLLNDVYEPDARVLEVKNGSFGPASALTDDNQLVRRTAVELLAEIGTRDALEALAITLNDPDIDLRLAAVYELADNESVAASALLQRYLSDTDPLVRNVAAEFLND